MITKALDATNVSLAEIEQLVEENQRRDEQRREAASASSDAAARVRTQREQLIVAARVELARDLLVTEAGLRDAIMLRETSVGFEVPIWLAMRQLVFSIDGHEGVDLEAARVARHALAGAGLLPAVRRDDSSFGSAKQIRDVPKFHGEAPSPEERSLWFNQIVSEMGIEVPRQAKPDCEPEHVTRARVERRRNEGLYDSRSDARNRELAERELELYAHKRRQATNAAAAAHESELLELRTRIVAGIDRALAGLELGIAWWWTRELRRHVAGEGGHRIRDAERVWYATQTLGVRFNLTGRKD